LRAELERRAEAGYRTVSAEIRMALAELSGCDEFRDGGTDWRWPRYSGWLAQPGRNVIDPVHLEFSED
jgi:hypothetical protein